MADQGRGRRLAAARILAAVLGCACPAAVGRPEVVWQAVAVPNGDFEQSGTGASLWSDAGLPGLSNSAPDYAGDVAVDVLPGWQFAAGTASRSLMSSGSRVPDPAVGGTRGQVARIEYLQGSRGHAAGYLTSEPIPDLTIPETGGRFRMELSHFVTGQARGVNFGFLTGPVTTAADVTQNWISGDQSNDAWGAPYELHAGHNTRHEGATAAWLTTRIYWDNTGSFAETFGLQGAIVPLPNGVEGYAAETVDGVHTIRYYTDKRGLGEGVRLGAFVRTNSAGGTGRLHLDGFSLWQESLLPAAQVWHGDGLSFGGDGEWSQAGPTWSRGAAIGPLVPGAMAMFPLPDGAVTIHEEGVVVTGGLAFEAGTAYTVTGGTLDLAGGLVTANTVVVGPAAVATIAAPLAGSAGLNKAGQGELVLTGAGGLTGTVLVAEGTLRVGHPTGLAQAAVAVSGGTLAAALDATLGDVTVDLGGRLVLDSYETRELALGGLAIDRAGAGAVVDLGVGRITIAAGADAATLLAAVLAGRGDFGDWNGTAGILSSAAAGSSGARGVGYLVAGDGSALLAFAAPGDTNLDGLVDTLDLVTMASSGKYGTGQAAVWAEGDFNYDGVVDSLDLVMMASLGVYGTGNYLPLPTPSGFDTVAVPEPGLALAAALAAGAAAARHARRRAARG